MLSKDRDARPTTAGAVRTALLDIKASVLANGPPSSATTYIGTPGFRSGTGGQPAPTTGIIARPPSRAPLYAGLAALLLAGAGGAAFMMTRQDNPTAAADTTSSASNAATEVPAAIEPPPADTPETLDVPAATNRGQQGVRLALAEATNSASSMRVSTPINSTPAGADIVRTDTGAVIGTTPFTLVTSQQGDPVVLTLRLQGREEATVRVDRSGQAVQATLATAGRGNTARPPRRPASDNNAAAPAPAPAEESPRSGFSLRRPVTIVE